MKITEQTLRELLVDTHSIVELIVEGKPVAPAKAFHLHTESCEQCQKHWKAMCDEGKRLLQEWAVSYTDSRVN